MLHTDMHEVRTQDYHATKVACDVSQTQAVTHETIKEMHNEAGRFRGHHEEAVARLTNQINEACARTQS